MKRQVGILTLALLATIAAVSMSAVNASGSTWPAVLRNDILHGCEKSGGSVGGCTCAVNRLESELTVTQVIAQTAESKKLADAAGTYCASHTAKSTPATTTTQQPKGPKPKIEDFHITRVGNFVVASGFDATDFNADTVWTFGDGTTVKNKTVASHTYKQSGSYTITLTITTQDGSTSKSQTVTITAPTATTTPTVTTPTAALATENDATNYLASLTTWAGIPLTGDFYENQFCIGNGLATPQAQTGEATYNTFTCELFVQQTETDNLRTFDLTLTAQPDGTFAIAPSSN